MSEQYSIVMANNGHFRYFHILAIMNKADINICVDIYFFFWVYT